MEWMVAAGSVAALAGAVYSAGCVNTTSDCALLGSCGGGAGTSTASESSASGASSASVTATATATATASASSTGTGGMKGINACEASRFGDANDQAARTIYVDPSGDTLLAGDFKGTLSFGTKSVTAAGDDVFVARLDGNGQATALQTFAVPYGAVVHDPLDGGVILAGPYTTTANLGCPALDNSTDLYLAKLGPMGDCQWIKGFIAPSAHVSLAVTATGNIALVGDAVGPMDFDTAVPGTLAITGGTGGGRDLFVVELGPDGTVISAVGYGGSGDEEANGVGFDAKGGMIITGTFTSPSLDFATGSSAIKNTTVNPQAFVARTGGSGKSWFVGFAGKGEQKPTTLGVSGALALVAGDFTDALGTLKSTGRAFFLLGLDTATGTTTWGKSFEGTGAKTVKALATRADGTIALTGSVDGDVDFGLGKLTSAGGVVLAVLRSSDGEATSNLAFGAASPLPSANALGFHGTDLFVAGAFSGTLALGSNMNVDSAGLTDIFVAKLCLP